MAENKGKLVQRSEIQEEFKWRIEDIYPSPDAWEEDFQKVKSRIEGYQKFNGKLGESAENLLESFKYSDETSQIMLKLFQYSARRKDQDTRISENQSLYNRVMSLSTELSSVTAFITPEILAIPQERLEEFLNSNAELAVYRHYLEDMTRTREHVLSPELEQVVAMTSEMAGAPNQIFTMLNNADIKYPAIKDEEGNEIQLTKGRYIKFLQSKDRRVRKDAFTAFYVPYENLKNTMAANLGANVKASTFYAKVRKYNSTLESSLDNDNVSVTVYDNLIKTVSDNLEPMYKYMRLRKKILGLDELHMYDLNVSIIKDLEIKIPYREATESIVNAVLPLGDRYQNILRHGFESGWVDVYESEGKASGAYSAGVYGVHPFVLMNYNETLDSMYTLAHEMGHALHSYFSNEAQPFVYHRYKIFLAEVASTLNEILLMDYLTTHKEDKNFKLAVLNHFLEQFRGTVYRQTMFAEFERLIHQKVEGGEPLTHELLGKMYHELNQKYYGPDMIVDPEISLEWSRIPHFYYGFYVYKYATGFSAATALAQKILDEGQPAIDRYLEFLKAGNSDYPINTLKKVGVDMSTPEPIEKALNKFARAVDEVEKLLG